MVNRRFFALPRRKAEWLRLPLFALAAYLSTVVLIYLLGFEVPQFREWSADVTFVYPLALLVVGSIVALFVERRLGMIFTAVWIAIVAVAALTPAL